MRKLSLTSLAGVVLVVLFFEGGQVSNVHLEALEIRNSNDQTNTSPGCPIPATKTSHGYNVVRVDEVRNTVFSWSHGCCVNNFNRTDYVITPGIGAHKLLKHQVTWNRARDICVRDGAQLAVINSDAEEALFRTWMSKNSLGGVWIGVHDMFQEDWWVTTTGEPLAAMSYNLWADTRPDKQLNGSHCGVLRDSPLKGIDNYPCDRKYAFICEINLC
ncbi:hemolymph lipopolysaccharide-binding protein-like [Halictus rubicundus]|uniref:hemolymph lipopolysaccharide-binding protein-like n=1 Tax=Halictus rubicundus TaxID=77578 RepID=UPI0040374F1A